MKRACRRLLGLALMTSLLLPVLASAQPDAQKDDRVPLTKNIAEWLESRRDKGKTPPNNELLKTLANELQKGFDPKKMPDPETLNKFLAKHREQLSDLQNLQGFRKLLEGARKNPPSESDLKLDKVFDQFQKTLAENKDDPRLPSDTPPPSPLNESSLQGLNADILKQTNGKKDDNAEALAKMLARNFGDSPAFRDFAKDFAKTLVQDSPSGETPKVLESIQNEWKSLLTPKKGEAPPDFAGLLSGLRMPELHSSSAEQGHADAAPRVGGSSLGGGLDVGDPSDILLIGGLVGASLLALHFYLRSRQAQTVKQQAAAVNAIVDPLAVATREDVVKAFEAVSVEKCGTDAINWHHRQIANELGGKTDIDRDGVDRLAGLYEKARYAPLHEAFTETEITEARARLRQIAGAPTE